MQDVSQGKAIKFKDNMQKATIYSLAVMIAAAGLLLGGNVRADGATVTTATQDVSSQIDVIRQKVAALSAEVKAAEAQTATAPAVTVPTASALTQAQLDAIAVRVAQIRARTEEIKVQVRILLEINAINLKIAAIKAQIAAMAGGTVQIEASPVVGQATPATTTVDAAKAAKIAQIKQQIAELTQEYRTQKNIEDQKQIAAASSTACQGDSCPASSSNSDSNQPVTIQVSPKTPEASENQNQGFWESIGNFFRKVFTF